MILVLLHRFRPRNRQAGDECEDEFIFSRFGETISIARDELRELVLRVLDKAGELKRVLVLLRDHTRLNSIAGPITAMVYEKLTGAVGIMDITGAMVAVEKLYCLCHTVR